MATVTKTKNGQITVDAMADIATQAREETKVTVDAMLDVLNIASESGKTVFDAQQKFMQTYFELCQQYTKETSDLLTGALQDSLEQAVALREKLSQIFEKNLKKSQDLASNEQNLILEAVEVYQAQMKASAERLGELFTPILNK